MKHYQVIIAGAGPAGSSTARILAAAGIEALLLDQCSFPRPKLCAGLYTAKTAFLLEKAFHLGSEELLANGVVNHSSNGFACFHKNRLITKGTHYEPFYFVDRAVFDHFLLGESVRAGAAFLPEHRVSGLKTGRKIEILAGGNSFSADYLIAADGVNSLVRRKAFPQDKQHPAFGLAATLEMVLSRRELHWPDNYPSVYMATVPQGYAWVFPHRHKIVIGIGGPVSLVPDLRADFNDFLRSIGLGQLTLYPAKGHLLPYGNYRLKPVKENILLAGDAGGFADPLLGEGIYYALRTGTAAAKAVIDDLERPGCLEQSYLKILQRDVYPEMIHAAKIRKFVHSPAGMDIGKLLAPFLRKPLLEAIHGRRSYHHLKRRAQIF